MNQLTVQPVYDGEIEVLSWIRARYKLKDKDIEFVTSREFTQNVRRGNIKQFTIKEIEGQWILQEFKPYITIY